MKPTACTTPAGEILDVVGIGIGPFNLSLAALLAEAGYDRTVFLERKPYFSWHPGMLLEGTTLQVPFLADLVSLVAPTSRFQLSELSAGPRPPLQVPFLRELSYPSAGV